MAVSNLLSGQVVIAAFNKEIDWDTDSIKATLHTSTMAPNQDTWKYVSSLTNELTTANGYTAGGITVTTPTASYNATGNVSTFDCDDFVWTATAGNTITARYCVVSDRTPGTAATQPIITIIDFGADVSATGSTLAVQINASGLWTATVS